MGMLIPKAASREGRSKTSNFLVEASPRAQAVSTLPAALEAECSLCTVHREEQGRSSKPEQLPTSPELVMCASIST